MIWWYKMINDNNVGGGESGVVKERPIHDNKQVLSPDELEVGKTYWQMSSKPGIKSGLLEIVAINIEEGKFEAKIPRLNTTREFFMYDKCIIPYENGNWNRHNYLVRAD